MDETVKEVALEFGLNLKLTDEPRHVALSKVYILENNYVLRARAFIVSTERDYEKEIALINLVRNKLPFELPAQIKTKNGKYFVVRNNLFWTVYHLIKGNILCSWQDISKIGYSEREKAMKSCRTMHDNTQGLFNDVSNKTIFIDEIPKKFEKVKHKLKVNVSERIENAINNAKQFIYSLETKDLCFVHGDFHQGNLVVDSNHDVIGLIDVDWCRIAYPIEDLAYCVMMYLRNYNHDSYIFDEKLYKHLLDSYKLEEEKKKIFVDLFILYALYDVWILDWLNINKREQYFNYQVSILNYFCENF